MVIDMKKEMIILLQELMNRNDKEKLRNIVNNTRYQICYDEVTQNELIQMYVDNIDKTLYEMEDEALQQLEEDEETAVTYEIERQITTSMCSHGINVQATYNLTSTHDKGDYFTAPYTSVSINLVKLNCQIYEQ